MRPASIKSKFLDSESSTEKPYLEKLEKKERKAGRERERDK